MPRPKHAIHEALVNRTIIAVALVVVAAGIGITSLGIWLLTVADCPKTLAELVKEAGTASFGIGILALIWELAARRAFMSEILATVDLSDEIEEQGLTGITFEYLQGVPWPEMFRTTQSFDVFFSYARTWTNANATHLQDMADRGVSIRVLLPDPADDRVMGELAIWYRTTLGEIKSRVEGSIKHYRQLATRTGARVEVRITKTCPLFTTYLFDRIVVFTTHSHRPAPAPVPTFIAAAEKPLYHYFRTEFDFLWADATPTPVPMPAEAQTKWEGGTGDRDPQPKS